MRKAKSALKRTNHQTDEANRADEREGKTAEPGNRRGGAQPPLPDAFAYTVPNACRMAGFGRTTLYKLAKDDRLRLVKVDGRTLVCGDSLRALIGQRTG